MTQAKIHVTPVAKAVPFEGDGSFAAENADDAIVEAKQNAEGFPRAGIPLVMNGGVSNGDWITYSNLTPDAKITFPVKSKINELTWANSNTGISFDLEFYKNGTAPGNLVYTYNAVRSSAQDFGAKSAIDLIFDVGDWLRIKYVDQGLNASDMVLVLFFSRVP